MKRIVFPCIFILLISMITMPVKTAGAYDELQPKDNEVGIYYSGVAVPLNRIILIRKNAEYCAIKFIKVWTEFDEERYKTYTHHVDVELDKYYSTKKYADYEGYYQGDGSGSFTKTNVKITRETASWLPLKGPFRPFIYQPGRARVECGPYRLGWQYKTFVSSIPKGKYLEEHGFELAPTTWKDIKEINVFDPRVKWYRYDEKREKLFIPIDKLWEK